MGKSLKVEILYKGKHPIEGNPLYREIPYKGKFLIQGNSLSMEILYKGKSVIKEFPCEGKSLLQIMKALPPINEILLFDILLTFLHTTKGRRSQSNYAYAYYYYHHDHCHYHHYRYHYHGWVLPRFAAVGSGLVIAIFMQVFSTTLPPLVIIYVWIRLRFQQP